VRAVQPPENAEHIRAVAADALARSLCDAFERAVASTDPSPTQE
jgi:hypothetical protein